MAASTVIWRSPTGSEPWNQERNLAELAARALAGGGRAALDAWLHGGGRSPLSAPGAVAHVHGDRHDLWWEFTLEASFRWQAHLCRMRPEVYQRRLRDLARALGLEGVLGREVAALTHGTRALADLAVALLPGPRLLLWEEPFYLMSQAEAECAVRLMEAEHAGGTALVAVSRERPGLDDLPATPRWPHGRRLHAAQ
ncbi:hypothetical protein [Symbiobacterium terraclitae]|uniref:hypothetical protein n=1 Tax=Symbiobacterium terraclitae TaxID=557451 RepID=UPI0035B55770